MLVILSDLHLNDGTTGATPSAAALTLFVQRLKELTLAASWRTDGAYRPIERLDLILLGDTFDLLHSARWCARPGVRPWSDPQSPELADQIGKITGDILSQNQESLAVLRSLSTEGEIALPPMLRAARPASEADNQPVTVRVHYMVGNHDWFYHLPGPSYDGLRKTLVEQMGLANYPCRPFAHDMSESEELLLPLRRHKVTARHGDVYDPLSFEGDRDSSSLSDAIVVELVNRFTSEVELSLGADLPDATVLELRQIDHIRPLLLVPVWLEGLLERTCPVPAVRKRAKMVWDRLTDELLSSEFVRHRDACSSLELVDGLQRALKFSKRMSSGWTQAILQWLQKVRGVANDSYYAHALTEPDFRNRRAKHVVYGHTHAAEIVPLDASHAEGYVLDQVYFNAGTWRRVFHPTRFVPGEHEFIASDTMTYLAFFQGDERSGRPYETWTGTLGHTPAETIVRRIDAGRIPYAAGQPVSTSGLSPHAPHFAALPGKTAGMPARRRS